MIQADFIKQLMLKKRIYYGNAKRERERECVMYTHGTGTYIISLADNELSIIFRIYIFKNYQCNE